MAARNLTFDDRDESHLVYESYWFHEGSWNASHVGKTGTLSSTELVDASVTFTFPGMTLELSGTLERPTLNIPYTEPANAFYYFGEHQSDFRLGTKRVKLMVGSLPYGQVSDSVR